MGLRPPAPIRQFPLLPLLTRQGGGLGKQNSGQRKKTKTRVPFSVVPATAKTPERAVPYVVRPLTDEIRHLLGRQYDDLNPGERLTLERWLNSQPWPEVPEWKHTWTSWKGQFCFRCGGRLGEPGTNRSGDGDYWMLCGDCWREKVDLMKKRHGSERVRPDE